MAASPEPQLCDFLIIGWGAAAAVLLSPAACFNLVMGQNAFLTLALLVGGIRLLDRWPLASGILLGLMTYKPQLWPMVPVALLASRAWKSLMAAVATGIALAAASAAAFGFEAWSLWLDELVHPAALLRDTWFSNGMNNGFGIYVCAILFGAPHSVALLVQVLVAIICAVAVFLTFKNSLRWQLRAAVLLYAAAL